MTGQDIEEKTLPGQTVESFSWDEVSQALAETEVLGAQRSQVLAFMRLWVTFERMMRFRSRRITLPIDRLTSPRILISQLYSHGEFNAQQFDIAIDLVRVRNQVFHGVDVSDVTGDLKRLAALVLELRDEWSRPTDEIATE